MDTTSSKDARVRTLIDTAITGKLTDRQAEELLARGPEAAKLCQLLYY